MKSKIDFINTNTTKSLMKMFIPLLAAMTLTMLYSIVDSFWVGNMLGELCCFDFTDLPLPL